MAETNAPAAPTAELEQYTCVETRRGRLVNATRPQQRVFLVVTDAEGKTHRDFVGYVADAPGSRFCPTTRDLDEAEYSAIDDAIEKFHGHRPPKHGSPPPADDDADADPDHVSDEELAAMDETLEESVRVSSDDA